MTKFTAGVTEGFLARIVAGVLTLLPVFGLLLILAYWWTLRPVGFSMGYVEDFSSDLLRHVMAENLDHYGKPTFQSDAVMAPSGISMPYMSWSIERDWIGAYFWKWNPHFPFLWVYVGFSYVISYLGVGWILLRMKLQRSSAWGLAIAVVLFHIPRHFKVWHHAEHLPQHWIYFTFFLDAWIWQRFFKEKTISVHLECWRAFLVLGAFCSTGYFWGPLILEWVLVRACVLALGVQRGRQGSETRIQWQWNLILPPALLGCILLLLQWQWFLPLFREVKSLGGGVQNNLAYFAYFYDFFRPLWLDWLVVLRRPFFENSETVSSLGWFWVIPFLLSLYFLREKKGGPGLTIVLPFLILILFAYSWESKILTPFGINLFRSIIPFMGFFRVASRWSLFLPAAIGAFLALVWSVSQERFLNGLRSDRRKRLVLGVFLLSSVLEGSYLFYPVNTLAPISTQVVHMMEQIRALPGTTVLDLPFCVVGGNGICQEEQCPNYPFSTIGLGLSNWHHKKVYGLYQARMMPTHCEIYHRQPYLEWFSAWKEQRCWSDVEWDHFCDYLEQHPELSALILHPDIWVGVNSPECQAKLEYHLGQPMDESLLFLSPSRKDQWTHPSRVRLYLPHCKR